MWDNEHVNMRADILEINRHRKIARGNEMNNDKPELQYKLNNISKNRYHKFLKLK